jgi:hypothetical protein
LTNISPPLSNSSLDVTYRANLKLISNCKISSNMFYTEI